MCTTVIRLSSGLHIRRFIECDTNADNLFYAALLEAQAEKGRMVSIEPCFVAIESAVRLPDDGPKARYALGDAAFGDAEHGSSLGTVAASEVTVD